MCQVSQCNHAKTTAKQLAEMVQLWDTDWATELWSFWSFLNAQYGTYFVTDLIFSTLFWFIFQDRAFVNIMFSYALRILWPYAGVLDNATSDCHFTILYKIIVIYNLNL